MLQGEILQNPFLFLHTSKSSMILLIHLVSTKKFPSYTWFVCNLIEHHSHNTTSTKWYNLVAEWKECHEMWQWKFGKHFWLMRSTRSWMSKQLIVLRIAVSLSYMTSSCVRVSRKVVTTIFGNKGAGTFCLAYDTKIDLQWGLWLPSVHIVHISTSTSWRVHKLKRNPSLPNQSYMEVSKACSYHNDEGSDLHLCRHHKSYIICTCAYCMST